MDPFDPLGEDPDNDRFPPDDGPAEADDASDSPQDGELSDQPIHDSTELAATEQQASAGPPGTAENSAGTGSSALPMPPSVAPSSSPPVEADSSPLPSDVDSFREAWDTLSPPSADTPANFSTMGFYPSVFEGVGRSEPEPSRPPENPIGILPNLPNSKDSKPPRDLVFRPEDRDASTVELLSAEHTKEPSSREIVIPLPNPGESSLPSEPAPPRNVRLPLPGDERRELSSFEGMVELHESQMGPRERHSDAGVRPAAASDDSPPSSASPPATGAAEPTPVGTPLPSVLVTVSLMDAEQIVLDEIAERSEGLTAEMREIAKIEVNDYDFYLMAQLRAVL